MYTAADIARILDTDLQYIVHPDDNIVHLTMDTRKLIHSGETLFFALKGSMHDGHVFIPDAIRKGVRNIVVEHIPSEYQEQVNFYPVTNVLHAMQQLAAWHKRQFPELTTLAITGSNGKTIIKEWLSQMITDRQVVKSPKSYNSQTGVALSLWQIKRGDQLGIFEAGLSTTGEMRALEAMIRPDIGLFTMIGDAHAEGFSSINEKIEEKLLLFNHCKTIVFHEDDVLVSDAIRRRFPNRKLLSWGKSPDSTLFRIINIVKHHPSTTVTITLNGESHSLEMPFSDSASLQNALHCVAVMLILGIEITAIQSGLNRLQNLSMRLEMKNGIHNSILINDTYNADLQSFKIALEFLDLQAGNKEKVLILSDFMQTGLDADLLNEQLADEINNHRVSYVIGIGRNIGGLKDRLQPSIRFVWVENTEQVLDNIHNYPLAGKAILIKGARTFKLERIIHRLSDKTHTAVLETDLQAIEHNLKVFSDYLDKNTGIISVIKASAYGSGSEELARFLEFKKVAYLAVAFIDEGVHLRQSGIRLPIIILDPELNGINDLIDYDLEPEVYSLEQLQEIISVCKARRQAIRVHLKLETGMHRLGFTKKDLEALCTLLLEHQDWVHVNTIFSHLSSSEDPNDDDYTHEQVRLLLDHYQYIADRIGYKPQKHILNSSGIIRFPEYHFDLVRLGLGLYGIDSTGQFADKLEKVHTLKASVIQIKDIKASESVGYNRRGHPQGDGKIAIINIGYADGLMRLAGNGKYTVRIQDRDFLILGNVCMDLTIIDLGTDSNVHIGDEVIIFGKNKPIETLAMVCQTIPYEILTRISSRIRRVFIQQ
ncbi:MAG: bifunctional UDP-N-acetylmuramoyl-tripeptide:D-alanyl-D-alanine ligase/alanine racemase [Saprospiraceae bacterium]|nr:MAG: alanine racemase [Bacteroidetes bacterium OLB9]MCO6464728.1 bifunctional UDP-N-acetylmuramoyl-tripeptide:D-alanyl-D-alanine ligase/alanine racemase [Saprospiraceae bacterium]